MPEQADTVTEAVASFSTRDAFEGAVAALLADGYERDDLSVFASHETLPDSDEPAAEHWLTGLVGELRWAAPITAAGMIAIAGGPVTAALSLFVGAGIGGLAVSDYLEKVTADDHEHAFAKAVEQGGVVLWVRAADDQKAAKALVLLANHGGDRPHLVNRPAG